MGWRIGGDLVAQRFQDFRHAPRGLALARAGAHRADRDDGLGRFDLRFLRADQTEVGAGGQHLRRFVHHIFVLHIRIGEDDLIDVVLFDQAGQVRIRDKSEYRRDTTCPASSGG